MGTDTHRTHTISLRVNAEERAELERRRQLAGYREMGAYIRTAMLAQRPPRAVVPALNRQAWLDFGRVAEELTETLQHARQDHLLDEDTAGRLADQLAALRTEVNVVRLALLGVD